MMCYRRLATHALSDIPFVTALAGVNRLGESNVSNKEPPTDSKPPNANRTPDEIALYVDIEHDKKFRIAGTSHELEQIGNSLSLILL